MTPAKNVQDIGNNDMTGANRNFESFIQTANQMSPMETEGRYSSFVRISPKRHR
jgi:hypothetical protein